MLTATDPRERLIARSASDAHLHELARRAGLVPPKHRRHALPGQGIPSTDGVARPSGRRVLPSAPPVPSHTCSDDASRAAGTDARARRIRAELDRDLRSMVVAVPPGVALAYLLLVVVFGGW